MIVEVLIMHSPNPTPMQSFPLSVFSVFTKPTKFGSTGRRLVEAAGDFWSAPVLIFSNLIGFSKYSFKDTLLLKLKTISGV